MLTALSIFLAFGTAWRAQRSVFAFFWTLKRRVFGTDDTVAFLVQNVANLSSWNVQTQAPGSGHSRNSRFNPQFFLNYSILFLERRRCFCGKESQRTPIKCAQRNRESSRSWSFLILEALKFEFISIHCIILWSQFVLYQFLVWNQDFVKFRVSYKCSKSF